MGIDWRKIKEKIYYEDGSLRDVVVSHWSLEEWSEWVKMVNDKYKLDFYNGQTRETLDKINFRVVKQYWEGKTDLITATIYLDQVTINCHFFEDIEFENDINPKEFKSVEDHLKFIEYLIDVSRAC